MKNFYEYVGDILTGKKIHLVSESKNIDIIGEVVSYTTYNYQGDRGAAFIVEGDGEVCYINWKTPDLMIEVL